MATNSKSFDYYTPTPAVSNPSGATSKLNTAGVYSFTATNPSTYTYTVPVCATGQTICPTTPLFISMLDGIEELPTPGSGTVTVSDSGGTSPVIAPPDAFTNITSPGVFTHPAVHNAGKESTTAGTATLTPAGVPELAIIDSILPPIGALDMIKQTQQLVGRPCPFVVVSSSTDLSLVIQAMRKGEQGYVNKRASLNELLQAINSAMTGKQYIGQFLKEDILAYRLADEPIRVSLSAREMEVLAHLCQGRSPKEIVDDMQVSLHTVRQRTKIVLRKFNRKRTTDLVVYAVKKGSLKPMSRAGFSLKRTSLTGG